MAERKKIDRLYRIWSGMKQRCNNPRHPSARWYHNKGIRVCKEWEKDFGKFQAWAIHNGYFPEGSIDRIDPEKGYSPDNCRWITLDENRRRANPKGKPQNRSEKVQPPQKTKRTEERIVDLIKEIADAKGMAYAEGLVEGIRIMTPKEETREQIMEVINFYLPTLTDRQLRMVRGFIRGLKKPQDEKASE